MADVAIPVGVTRQSCIEWSKTRPAVIVLSMLVGCLLSIGGWQYISASLPPPPDLRRWEIVTQPDGRGPLLVLSYKSVPSNNCRRAGIYIMAKIDADNGRGTYWLLGATLNGKGYLTPLSVPDFDVLLPIRDVPPGSWNFSYRIDYECGWLNLFPHSYVTPPVVVTIP